jgi:DNA polymerase
VGEAPGFYEDREGKPFVGAAGQLLERLLGSIGLTRADVYIANVLKCRPPQNRDPLPEEIEACKPFLFKQIEIIKPKVICTLGNFATRLILEKNVSISQVRGKKIVQGNHIVFPLFHPAAALHASTNLSSLEEDFHKLKGVLEEPVEIQPQPEQTSLF